MNSDRLPLTVLIVTFNEAKKLRNCLQSFKKCSEIIVVDLGSKDDSVKIAEEEGAKVFKRAWAPVVEMVWPDVVGLAQNSWVVRADPDEVYPENLLKDIQETIANTPNLGMVRVPHRFYFCRKPLYTTRWGQIKSSPKVFHKDRVMFKSLVHAGIDCREDFDTKTIAPRQDNLVIHYWCDSYREFFQKHRRYIQKEGEAQYHNDARFSWKWALSNSYQALRDSLVRFKGIRGGFHGVMLSFLHAWYVFMSALSLSAYEKKIKEMPIKEDVATKKNSLLFGGSSNVCPLDTRPIPQPQDHQQAWPWRGSKQLISLPRKKRAFWPRVSIVTPSFNQGRFIEETIRSVVLQNYPNLEYIIMDGGSDDDTVEIIKKYESHITYWESQKDRGQCHAVNKGFAKCTGEIFTWLNSDDILMPEAIDYLVELRDRFPTAVGWTGAAEKKELNGKSLGIFQPRPGTKREFGNFGKGACIYQPSTFIDAACFKKIGGLNEALEIGLDPDLWMRLAEIGAFATTDKLISMIRMYPEAKHLQNPAATYVELIAINFNHGFRDIAEKWIKKYAERYKP